MVRGLSVRRALKWIATTVVVLLALGILALFVIDRRLNPPVDAPALEPLSLPVGEQLVAGTVLYDSDTSGSFEVWSMTPEGTGQQQLTNDDRYDSWWARLSPDRRTILFYRTPAGVHDLDYTKTSLWMMAADGGDPIEVLPQGSHGWNQHGHAEWSPDGRELVMFGGKVTNPRIFVTSADGRSVRAVADEQGTNLDPSWSPDGSQVAYVGCPSRVCFGADQEIYVVPAIGGERRRLTNDDLKDHDPYFSPDGQSVAMLTQVEGPNDAQIVGIWDIRVVPAGGDQDAAARRLIGDNEVNSMPKWVDATTIIFHRLEYGALDDGFDLWEVDVVTGEYSEVFATSANEEYPDPS